jgi:hypothetical protein
MQTTLRTKVLIGLAALIALYVVFAPEESADTATPAKDETDPARRPRAAQPPRHAAAAVELAASMVRVAHRVTSDAGAEVLFAAHSWYRAPPAPPAPKVDPAAEAAAAAQAAAAAIPQAPPLPFAYMGSYTPDGGQPVFFLTSGDRVYDVRVGDTLDDNYSVLGLQQGYLVILYKPLNAQQLLAAGVGQ